MKRDSARDLEGTVTQETLKSCWTGIKYEVKSLPVNTNLNSELKGAIFKSFISVPSQFLLGFFVI